MNDRPITPGSRDPKDLPALTPSMLLLMTSNSSIPQGMFIKEDSYDGGGGKYSISQMPSGRDGHASTYLRYRLNKNGRGLKQTYVLVTSC